MHDGAGLLAGQPSRSPQTHGIYIDDQCERVRVAGNTVVVCGKQRDLPA